MKYDNEILTVCAEWLVSPDNEEPKGLRYALMESIIEVLDGAMVLADCHAETQGGQVFRDNNDNYMRLADALKIFKAAMEQ